MTDSEPPRSKVERLITEYGLDGAGMELETRWTREEDRWSLRDLADWFNRQLLEQALTGAGIQPVDGEVSNDYRLLTDDDVSGGDRVQLRRRLDQAGVDVDGLLDDFVTYQAIRSYLTEIRDASYDHGSGTTPESVQDRIESLAGRTERVTESQIAQLRDNGEIEVGDFRLLVDVQLYCRECNEQYDIAELLERGGCGCLDQQNPDR